jgi:2-C-methyl-D-erythritol 4-phosphate cytidylyltransferase
LLARFIQQLKSDPVGGILALPAKDTLKRSHMQHNAETNTVEHTLDRDFIWLAQTPQMFRFSLLFDAIEQGLHSNAAVTDEASAMEMAGHKPRLIKGDARNIKLTTPDDLALIEFLLS